MQALILSTDNEVVRTLRRVLNDLEIAVEHCRDLDQAAHQLTRCRFEAVIVDGTNRTIAEQVLRTVQSAPGNAHAIRIFVGDENGPLDASADFVLRRPLQAEQARRTLRTALAAMKSKHLANARVPVEIPVIIGYSDHNRSTRTQTLDLSERGMKVRLPVRMQLSTDMEVRFTLPGTDQAVQCPIEMAWRDASSHAGFRFRELGELQQAQLSAWLTRCLPS